MARKSKKRVTLPKISLPGLGLDMDGPTPERVAKLPGVTLQQRRSGTRVLVIDPAAPRLVGDDGIARMPSPFDQLAARFRLDEQDAGRNAQLYDAGDRLRQHWYHSGLGGAVGSIDLNRSGGGNGHPAWLTPSQEVAAYHRERFRRARDRMEAGHWQVVFAIVCGEETLKAAGQALGFGHVHAASAVALDRLRRGLEFLAVLYGILPPRPINDNLAPHEAERVRSTIVRGDAVDQVIEGLMLANAVEALDREAG